MENIEAIVRSDAICAIIFVFLAVLLYAETRFKTRADKWIATAILSGLFTVLVCIAAWLLDTVALTTPFAQTVGTWVQFLSYTLSPFSVLAFLTYTWHQTGAGESLRRRWVSVPFVVVLLVFSMLAYATASGLTIVYDETGHEKIKTLDTAVYALDLLLMVYACLFTFARRHELGRLEALVLCSIYVVGGVGLVLESMGSYFCDLGFVGMALCMIVAVIFIPVKRSIRAKESESAKSMFVASVSHDIRTPLNAILGFAAVLRDKSVSESEREQALEAITASGNLLMGLVNDVLDFSKIERGMMSVVPEPTDVAALVEEAVMVFRGSTTRSAVRVTCAHDVWTWLEVDGRRLRQILFNLLGNAVKFTTEGEIALRASYLPAQNGLGTLIMSVSDTGIGIPAERQGELMQPYVQLHRRGPNGGTGLGLYICRRLAEAMGGTLTLASECGKGSTFTLTLYGVRAVAAKVSQDAKTGGLARSVYPRVLLVDDTDLNLKVTKALLRRIGCTDVVLARNGAEALATLKGDPSIECVLTDMWMPGMDGNALALAIRADPSLAKLPVYAVTGDADAVVDGGTFNGVLLKPITADNLKAVLRKTVQVII